MTNLTDKELCLALKSGKIDAFDALYYKYHKRLFAFLYKMCDNWHDAEDMVQKIFVKIWERKEGIDVEKSFNSYLFTIAQNEAYDLLKKRALLAYHNDYIFTDVEDNEDNLESKKRIETIYSLINEMPERRRHIFLLNRDDGLTYRQIAEKLNISENTVDTQIRNALNYLRKELPKYFKVFTMFLLNIF
ncbi:RNA polymerase sigma-70 factor [Maribellus luteus]|uniref:RNA polymerase sigma-70 factor n=2 Tax=Maribellus luteus TaxID=2305463 RepID=A0A399T9A8_9BACT|nr:RNA polymerase sigma-70 factor [Maribellus luteus]